MFASFIKLYISLAYTLCMHYFIINGFKVLLLIFSFYLLMGIALAKSDQSAISDVYSVLEEWDYLNVQSI